MRSHRLRGAWIPVGLGVFAFALALAQRPGRVTTDTKINLNVDPVGFLGDVASTWTSTGQLGHVWGGQYAGYLFPMGPFFALGHVLGVSPWVVERLWLGSLLALAAWGTVRLLDAMLERERGVAHLVAGAIVLLNPYVVVFTNRTSVTLLGYTALPWLLLAVHRGVRDRRRWWWPAAFGLIVAATGAGVNAAVTGYVLLGPLLLLGYELLAGGVAWREARAFVWRTGATTLVLSLWWIAPAIAQALYGNDFLKFTEQPGTIWGTTSVSESLRLMGFWLSYEGVGYGHVRPYFADSPVMLFRDAVVVATLLVPALALGGFAWTRRWRYGPFFLALVLLGLLVMVAGFPNGTPLRRGLNFTYNHVRAVDFLRTTYKAGPLVALGVACLGGAAAAELWRRVALLRGRSRAALAVRIALPAGAAALLAVSAWPLTTGRGVDPQLAWKRIPPAWTHAARDLDRQLPRNTRAVLLPGQLFAFYRWGGTVDPVLPALASRPVAARFLVPFANLHAIDAQLAVVSLIDQGRLVPGQLRPLLSALGAGAAVVGSDDDRARSGAIAPARAAALLSAQGLDRPSRSYGPLRRFQPDRYQLGVPVRLPQVRRFDLTNARGIVRVEPAGPTAVVDGSASGLADLAAFGALPADRPIAYAGDRSAAQLRQLATAGGEVVISDSNRRRVFVPSRLQQDVGWTLSAGDDFSADAAVLDPFAGRGSDAQTVAVYDGARYVRAPFSPGYGQFPEHRPYAAFDGSLDTSWLADSSLETSRRWVEIGFRGPRDIDHIDVAPYSDGRAVVRELEVAGRRFRVHEGWNRLVLGVRGVRALRIRIAKVRQPHNRSGGAGGLREVRIPGLAVREWLRPPVLAQRALAGTDLRRTALTYLFERTTGDDPFERNAIEAPAQDKQALDHTRAVVRDRGDGERAMAREFDVIAPRAFTADAWLSLAPETPDHVVDWVIGVRADASFDSSSRFQNRPGFRASGAFDGDPASGWVGSFIRDRPAWIAWRMRSAVLLRRLVLRPVALGVRFPTRVRLSWPGGRTPPLAVGRDGAVTLPREVRAARFRLDVLAARFPAGTPKRRRGVAAVGIGELTGVPGLGPVSIRRSGTVHAPCGVATVRAGGRAVAMRFDADLAALDRGTPLRASNCGTPLTLGAGRGRLTTDPGPFEVDLLRLRSPAPEATPASTGGGRVLSAGRAGHGRYDGVRVALHGPAWLVLAEGYSKGWRAYCDGRSLGRPVVLDGFANAWRAPRDCRAVRFQFAPNRIARWFLFASALAALILGGMLLLRRRRGPAPALLAPLEIDDAPARWPLGRAAAVGLAAGAVLGVCFAVRAGVVIAPAVTLILWRGISPRGMILTAGVLLAVVVPVLYLAIPVHDSGGYSFRYPVDRIEAHWVAVAAVVLLIIALWRTLASGLRRT